MIVPFARRRWIALALVGLLVGAGALELGLHLYQRGKVAPRRDWQAAADAARRDLRKGDLIVTAPEWADPLGRLMLGDQMTFKDVTRPDAATYGRIWELSIRGARHPDTRGARVAWQRWFGLVRLTRYEKRPVRVTTDFYEALHRAKAWEERRGKRQPCQWGESGKRFDCGARWKAIRQVYGEIGFSPRRCVLAHPLEDGARIIEYQGVALGSHLVVYTGLKNYDPRYRARRAIWEYQRWKAGRLKKKRPPRPIRAVPVTLQVSVNGRTVGRVLHDIWDETWHRHVIKLPTVRPTAQVRFTITTRHAWAKHFCFYARSEVSAHRGSR